MKETQRWPRGFLLASPQMSNDGPPVGGSRLFGTLLRFHRGRLGLTQDQLAGRARMGARTIRELEAGRVRRPRGDSVRLLVEALGLDDRERLALQRAIVPGPAALR